MTTSEKWDAAQLYIQQLLTARDGVLLPETFNAIVAQALLQAGHNVKGTHDGVISGATLEKATQYLYEMGEKLPKPPAVSFEPPLGE